MTMDGSPIIDKTPVEGLYFNGGWCYGGFKATPASGFCFAHLIARDTPHGCAASMRLDRFRQRLCDRRERARAPSRISLTDANCLSLLRRTRRWRSSRSGAKRRVQRPRSTMATSTPLIAYVHLRDNEEGPTREHGTMPRLPPPGWWCTATPATMRFCGVEFADAMTLATGGLIDRGKPLRFRLTARPIRALPATRWPRRLLANGETLMGRSPLNITGRAVFSRRVEEPNALVELRRARGASPTPRPPRSNCSTGWRHSQNRFPS